MDGSSYRTSPGRIRIEANEVSLLGTGDPPYSMGLPGAVAQVWPEAGDPRIMAVSLAGVPITPPLTSEMINTGLADVTTDQAPPHRLIIEAENIPSDISSVTMTVRMTQGLGEAIIYPATRQVENGDGTSTWFSDLDLSEGFSAIQVDVETN